MDIFTQILIDDMPPVERGGIYQFLEKDGSCKKYAIVVSADYRKSDRFISIITLTNPDETKDNFRRDSIGITTPMGDFTIHCGMVTYLRRDRLGNMVFKVGKKTRSRINTMISFELGITDRPGNYDLDIDNKEPDYKLLYNQLLSKIAKEAQATKK